MVPISLAQKVHIRHATQLDLPALEWEGEFTHFRHVFSEAYRLMELGEVIMWIAELQEFGLIGQLFIQLYGPKLLQSSNNKHAYIYGFRVRSQFQGQGIGSRLLKTAEQDLERNGFQRIALNVARDNASDTR
jgi:ribosomal protein S18 acetylase RimI-like enzyme